MAGLMGAKVKSVTSGDTIVLHALNNPKAERILSLAFVSAPRLRKEGDEPFAFASRDYLRKLLVGKEIRFRVLYQIPTTKRDYGLIYTPDGKMFPELLVQDGWVKMREDAGKREESEEVTQLIEKLQAAEAHAKADSKGLWADDQSVGRVECAFEVPDAKSFVEQEKGKNIEGTVERVLSGDRLIVRLLLSPKKHVQLITLIAGIRAPSTKRVNDGKEQPAEPFGEEAQQFMELRLLQRNVIVNLLGVSPQNQVIATIKHPVQGSIAPHILKAGLARCTDFHSTLLGSDMASLRQAEQAAKSQSAGLFRGQAPTARSGGSSESEAVVSRILSADTIFLRNKNGAEKRVNLSSVRQPKPSDPKQAPWGTEAKEFLRKKLIGKHVKFHIDGKRAATEGYEEREMATITSGGKNVGMLMVENGYASVIRHRQDDPDRSPVYDDLLQAESQAQAEQKGMWSAGSPEMKNMVDYSESLEKAKRMASVLSRQKRVPAVVDFVKSGSRFTVLIPRENAKITLVLSGIRAPKSARNASDKGEPFGQEAHEFANRRCLQRDVEIDVEDTDKVGGFIGTLYINRENFTKLLVEEGLASVHAYSAEKAGNATELFAAEQKAKESRRNMWANWDPSQDQEAANGDENGYSNGASTAAIHENGDASSAATRKADYRDVIVTHIDESGRLKIQQIGKGTAALSELMTSFRNFHISKANDKPLDGPPKAGDYVAAQFSADGDWYRARVRRNDREKKLAEVVYVDYGNSEMLSWSKLRALGGSDGKFGVDKLKPQATDASLSFVQLPSGSDYLSDAIGFLAQATDGKQLVAAVDFVDKDGSLAVTLFDAGSSKIEDSLNADLVAEGLGLVPRKLKPWERSAGDVLGRLKEREKEAQEGRRGVWEYGDLTGDD